MNDVFFRVVNEGNYASDTWFSVLRIMANLLPIKVIHLLTHVNSIIPPNFLFLIFYITLLFFNVSYVFNHAFFCINVLHFMYRTLLHYYHLYFCLQKTEIVYIDFKLSRDSQFVYSPLYCHVFKWSENCFTTFEGALLS